MIPPARHGEVDHAATEFALGVFLLARQSGDRRTARSTIPRPTENGWFACPDNFAFDRRGRLWIATDGRPDEPRHRRRHLCRRHGGRTAGR